jgi:hypothetical protein
MSLDAVSGLTSRFPSASALLQAHDRLPTPGPLPPLARPGTQTAVSVETSRPTSMTTASDARAGAPVVWLALAGGIALGGLVAGAFFATRPSRSVPGLPMTTVGASVATGAAAALPTTSAVLAAGAGAHETSDESWHPVVVPPQTAVPSATRSTPAESHAPRQVAVNGGVPIPVPPSSGPAPQAASSADLPSASNPAPTGTAKALAGDPPGEQSLEDMMRKVVGSAPTFTPPPGSDNNTHKAADTAAGLPAKPSLGAVQGAVGAVMPATRYCLGPDDPVAQATITFQSDGSAQTVAVSGSAAGQPAEACIRSRLMGARVAPFSNPTFTWTVTVRPAS